MRELKSVDFVRVFHGPVNTASPSEYRVGFIFQDDFALRQRLQQGPSANLPSGHVEYNGEFKGGMTPKEVVKLLRDMADGIEKLG